jgi:hypothetical protein
VRTAYAVCMLPPSLGHIFSIVWKIPGHFSFLLLAAAIAYVRRWWEQRKQRLLTEESKDWPTYRARVIAAQAVKDKDENSHGRWMGLLTYSYIADEVEIGEYKQLFRAESDADDWARYLRGRTLTVAVDPRDHRRSIWLKDEADAAVEAVTKASKTSEPVPLSAWMEFVRVLMIVVAALGAGVSLWAEVEFLLQLSGRVGGSSDRYAVPLAVAAIGCSLIAGWVFAKRFPGRSMQSIAGRFTDPVVKLLLKGLGVLEGVLGVWLWTHFSLGDVGMNDLVSSAIGVAAWGGIFAASAVALWVAGTTRREAHELSPEARR